MNALDKEEYRIKLEEINKLIEKKNYESAMEIVDSIDWRKVKNIRTLCVVGEIYAANKRYADSKEIFLLAYHRAPIGKTILYRLIEVSLRMGDVQEAEEFFEEYRNIAPNDTSCYVLQYKVLRVKKAPIEQQIAVLEEYKDKEFTEKWSFELAKLYYKAGDREKAIEVCDDLILWFSEGKYVTKALDLKLRMGAISESERERYEKQFIPKLITPEEAAAAKEEIQERQPEEEMESDKTEASEEEEVEAIKKESEESGVGGIAETAGVFQEKIAKGIKDIFSGIHRDRREDELFHSPLEENAVVEENTVVSTEKNEEYRTEESDQVIPDQGGVEEESREILEKDETSDDGNSVPGEFKIPEMKIPNMIKIPDKIETPKAKVIPEFVIPTEEELRRQEEEKNQQEAEPENINLEDKILEAASRQGIQVPAEENLEEMKSPSDREVVEVEDETEQPGDDIFENSQDEQSSQKGLTDSSEEATGMPEERDWRQEETVEAFQDELWPQEDLVEVSQDERQAKSGADELSGEEQQPQTEVVQWPGEEIVDDNFENEEDLELEQIDLDGELEKEKKVFLEQDAVEKEREITADYREEEKAARDIEIIPREMKFDDEEEELFTYFVKIPGMKEQILDTLLEVQMAASDKTSKTGNVIVMGNKGCGKTRLIQGLVPAICRELGMEASKVAYVFGDELNGQEIPRVVDKLSSGFLVIEQANQMNAETVSQLNQAMEFRTDGLTVIIEDEKIGMRKLIAKYPKFAAKFTSMINIPVFTNDELVSFAKIYTKENGYVIDQMGILALYNLIGDNQKEDEPMTIYAVKQMVDAAIEKAESGARKLTRNLSKKRTDVDGKIVLYEKDFS